MSGENISIEKLVKREGGHFKKIDGYDDIPDDDPDFASEPKKKKEKVERSAPPESKAASNPRKKKSSASQADGAAKNLDEVTAKAEHFDEAEEKAALRTAPTQKTITMAVPVSAENTTTASKMKAEGPSAEETKKMDARTSTTPSTAAMESTQIRRRYPPPRPAPPPKKSGCCCTIL